MNATTISAGMLKTIPPYQTRPVAINSLSVLIVTQYPTHALAVNGLMQTLAIVTTVQILNVILNLNVHRRVFISSHTPTTVTNTLYVLMGMSQTCALPFIGEIQYYLSRFPIPMHCPDGLYFDREYNTCNFPEFAECTLEVCPPENDPDNIVYIPSEVNCEK